MLTLRVVLWSLSRQANEMLLSGRKLTAQEACAKGLVSQVLWPGTFTQEVMLRIKELVSVNSLVCRHTPRTTLIYVFFYLTIGDNVSSLKEKKYIFYKSYSKAKKN